MNAIEKKHYEAIEKREFISEKANVETFYPVPTGAEERCSVVTEEVAIRYAEWYESNVLTWGEIYGIQREEKYEGLTDDELFDLFIKETYGG
jgi:hypothetical protein